MDEGSMSQDAFENEVAHDEPTPACMQHAAAWSHTEQSVEPLADPPVPVPVDAPVPLDDAPEPFAPPVPPDVPRQADAASLRQEVRSAHDPSAHLLCLLSNSLTSQFAVP